MVKYLTILALFLICASTSIQAQTSEANKELQNALKELESNFMGFIGEFEAAFEEGKELLGDPETIQKHGEDGDMIVMDDTINVTTLFDFMVDKMEMLPEPFRPKQDMIEGQKEISKMLPDLLLQASDLFQNLELNDMEDMLKGMDDQLEEVLPPAMRQPENDKKSKKDRKVKKI